MPSRRCTQTQRQKRGREQHRSVSTQIEIWEAALTGRLRLADFLEWPCSDALDPQWNFVLQLCIVLSEPKEHVRLCVEFKGCARRLAWHKYGCRSLIRLIEQSAPSEQFFSLIAELENDLPRLAKHCFGSYVVQALLEHAPFCPGLDDCVSSCVQDPAGRGALAVLLTAHRQGRLKSEDLDALKDPARLENFRLDGTSGRALAAALESESPVQTQPEPVEATLGCAPVLCGDVSQGLKVVFAPVWYMTAVTASSLTWTAREEEIKEVVLFGQLSRHMGKRAFVGWCFGLDLFLEDSEKTTKRADGTWEASLTCVIKFLGGLAGTAAPRLIVSGVPHDFARCHLLALPPVLVNMERQSCLSVSVDVSLC